MTSSIFSSDDDADAVTLVDDTIMQDDGIMSAPLDDAINFEHSHEINPATGLPLTGDIGSVDVMGNPYGMDNSDDPMNFNDDLGINDSFASSDFDNNSGFDDSFDSMFDDDL